jgi:phosphatidylglycerophosphatase A
MDGVSNLSFKSLTENGVIKREFGCGGGMESELKTLPLLKYLEDHGITLKDLINTALELFVPHPGVETRKEAIELLKAGFFEALSDVNVSLLEVACFRVEEDARAGLVPSLPVERFVGRPGLIVDELLGMTIANYIAGSRGVFEFIPGVSSKIYSNALEQQRIKEQK